MPLVTPCGIHRSSSADSVRLLVVLIDDQSFPFLFVVGSPGGGFFSDLHRHNDFYSVTCCVYHHQIVVRVFTSSALSPVSFTPIGDLSSRIALPPLHLDPPFSRSSSSPVAPPATSTEAHSVIVISDDEESSSSVSEDWERLASSPADLSRLRRLPQFERGSGTGTSLARGDG